MLTAAAISYSYCC